MNQKTMLLLAAAGLGMLFLFSSSRDKKPPPSQPNPRIPINTNYQPVVYNGQVIYPQFSEAEFKARIAKLRAGGSPN